MKTHTEVLCVKQGQSGSDAKMEWESRAFVFLTTPLTG